MALSPRLELRQGQGLVITPQLQQAIKLLQLSNLELEAFVEGELERNPLLQREDREDGPEGEAESPAADSDVASEHDFDADRVTDSVAAADIDVRHDDLYDGASPGDLATGDAGPTAGADAGGSVDWSKAGARRRPSRTATASARAAAPASCRFPSTWRPRWRSPA